MRPACSVYCCRVSPPSSWAIWAKATLQLLAKASLMFCSPWVPEQMMVSPPITMLPWQSQVRSNRSGISSMAAARVTVLNTDPGVKVEERKRFRYAPR